MTSPSIRPLILTALGTLLAGGAAAQSVVSQPDGELRGSLGLGASVASGNTQASSLALNADAVRETSANKLTAYGRALRTSAEGETTAEQLRAGGRYDLNFTPMVFGFGGLDFERNKLANLKLRGLASVGAGYRVLKIPALSLDVFGGVAYTADRYVAGTVIGDSATPRNHYSYASLLLGEEYAHALSPTTSLKQRLLLLPNLKDRGEYRANLDVGLAVAMTHSLSLNLGLGVAYNSDPGLGVKGTDSLFTTGVSMKF
jgi:putative salt-induced outer membrane protein YdiY